MGLRTSREDFSARWIREFQSTKGEDPQMHCPIARSEGHQFHHYNPDAVHPLQARIAEQARMNDELRWKIKAPKPTEPTVIEICASGRKPQPAPEFVDNAAYFSLSPTGPATHPEQYARSSQAQPSHVFFVKESASPEAGDAGLMSKPLSRQERLEALRAELQTVAGTAPPTEDETRSRVQAHADLLCQRGSHHPLRVLVASLVQVPPPRAPLYVRLRVAREAPLRTASIAPDAPQLLWNEQLALAVPRDAVTDSSACSMVISVIEDAGDVQYEGEVDLTQLVRELPATLQVPLLPPGDAACCQSGALPTLHITLTPVGFGLTLGPQGRCNGMSDAAWLPSIPTVQEQRLMPAEPGHLLEPELPG